MVFVCVSNNHVDAVDRLLIIKVERVVMTILLEHRQTLKWTDGCYQKHYCSEQGSSTEQTDAQMDIY